MRNHADDAFAQGCAALVNEQSAEIERLKAINAKLLDACRQAEKYATHAPNAPLGTRIELRRVALTALRSALAAAQPR